MYSETITAMLVDDDLAHRLHLRDLLESFEDVRLVGQAANVADAARIYADRQPELVLLEVNLPLRSGFELLPQLGADTQAVFVTEQDSYAVQAFEVNVIDYLLKTVEPDRLRLALNRVRRNRRVDQIRTPEPEAQQPTEILLHANGSVHVVAIPSITFVKAVGNYTQVNLEGGKRLLVRRSMESWLDDLPGQQFCRPHRSLIVNLELMTRVVRHSRDLTELEMRGCETTLTLGRRAAQMLLRTLKDSSDSKFLRVGC